MAEYNLKIRTKQFAVQMLKLVDSLPNKTSTKVISYQLAKSSSSVGANYRAASRARSDKEFVSKMNIVLEEADETQYWLELLELLVSDNTELIRENLKETDELISIFVTILKNTKNRMNNDIN